MSDLPVSTTELAIGLAVAVTVGAFAGLVLMPVLRCYGRVWEKLAASFLSLFILATLLGIGAGIGFAVVWTYDQYGA